MFDPQKPQISIFLNFMFFFYKNFFEWSNNLILIFNFLNFFL